MANTKSAAKRARQTERRTLENKRVLSFARTSLKETRSAIASGNKEAAIAQFKKAISTLDKGVKGGRIHANTAARQKSTLNRAISKLS